MYDLVAEVRLPMLEYDFSKHPDQGFDEMTGEHGGYEMGVRGSGIYILESRFHDTTTIPTKISCSSTSICSHVSFR